MPPRLLTAVLIVAVAMIAAGCGGGPNAEERQATRTERLNLLSPELQDRLDKQVAAVKTACENAIGDFVDSVAELDSRLNVGLSYDDYTSKVANISVEHDKVVDGGSLTGACYQAAKAAESAMNSYLRAQSQWHDCFDDENCTTDSILGSLQAKWSTASGQDEKSKAALAKIAGSGGKSLGTKMLPATSAAISETIYGTISSVICAHPDPPATAEPCAKFRNTIAGGVTTKEEGELNDELDDLAVALGLKSS
jgi:hypothetical protein